MWPDRWFNRTGRWNPPAPSDTTAPTITSGPTVSAITTDTATVGWSLDEAATGQVGYGLLEPSATTGAVAVADHAELTGVSNLDGVVSIPKTSLAVQPNDVVVLFIGKPLAGVPYTMTGTTTGWTMYANIEYETYIDQQIVVAVKRIVSPSSEPALWQFTRGPEGLGNWSVIGLCLRGVASPIVDAAIVYSEGPDDFTPPVPGITTQTNGALVITGHFSGCDQQDRTSSTAGGPSGFTMLPRAVLARSWMTLAYKNESTAGVKAYGSWTHSPNNTTDEYQVWTLAIQPSSTGGGGGWTHVTEYDNVTTFESDLLTSHSQGLTGLAEATQYHYAVESADAAGNFVTSSDSTFTTEEAEPPGPEPPPPAPGGFPTTLDGGRPVVGQWSNVSEPGYLQEWKDPNFEGSITRITPNGSDWRARYPKESAWNADMSLMVCSRSTGGPRLLDGTTYEYISELGSPYYTDGSSNWLNTEPNHAYCIPSSGTVYKSNPLARSYEVIGQLPSDVKFGISEGRQSNDDRYLPFSNNAQNHVYIFDAWNGTYVDWGTSVMDWVGMSSSGNYVVIRFDADGSGNNQGVNVFTRNGNWVRHLENSSHGDVHLGPNGEDRYCGRGTGAWRSYDLATGERFDVAFGAADGHCSGVAHQYKGWVLISNHYPGRWNEAGCDQIALCNTDGSGQARVFCHARTIQNLNEPGYIGRYTYSLSTHAVVSPDGRRVTWGGAWQRWTTDNSTPHGYVVRIAP